MKGTLKKPAVDVTAALDSANAATAATARPEPEETDGEGLKYVNLRFKAGEYMRLKKAYGGQGFNLTTGIRKAAVYIADQIEAGALTMTEGGVYPKRG
ncbi:MAG: hypothetical protein LBB83_04290 [Treponema sp.]|jgi:hypothetical protein|nr:hypothetical protein [Treponema sp.]